MKKIGYIFIFFFGLYSSAQEDAYVIGYAPEFVGKKVTLYTYEDFITMTKYKISEGFVDKKDSLFKIKNPVKSVIKAFIEIENTETNIYLAPETTYKIVYKKPIDAPLTFANQYVQPIFYGLDTNDINFRIMAYHDWFDNFIAYHKFDIAKHGISAYIDTFKLYAFKSYAHIDEPYFTNYIRYSIASMEQTKHSSKAASVKREIYLNYIFPFPVYSNHDQYMNFVKNYYVNDFDALHPEVKESALLALENSSASKLMLALKKDPLLQKDELREMIMLNMLGKCYYKRGYKRRNLLTIIDSVSNFALYPMNAVIAKNMKTYLTKLETGYPAPQISFIDKKGKPLDWTTYEGKFVYFNFFASWNEISVKEMSLIKEYTVKYGEYVAFLSISTDKTKKDFDDFMKKHPEFDWDIFYVGENSEVAKDFNVKAIPAYFLIDQSGYIALAPAKSPSPDGSYETIESTLHFIKTEMSRPANKRVGTKD